MCSFAVDGPAVLGAALFGERVGPWFLVGGGPLLAAVVVIGRAWA